jgi:hypothetical protein
MSSTPQPSRNACKMNGSRAFSMMHRPVKSTAKATFVVAAFGGDDFECARP